MLKSTPSTRIGRGLLVFLFTGLIIGIPACGKELGDPGAPCIFGSDCKDSLKCVNERCASGSTENTPCTKDSECEKGLKCVEKKCQLKGKSCEKDGDCSGKERCSGQKCLEPLGNGEPCLDTKGCKAPLVCDAKGRCGDTGKPGTKALGEACSKTEDCQRGLACDPKKKQCQEGGDIGAPCTKNQECKKELACAHDKTCTKKGEPGTVATNERCNKPTDCQIALTCSAKGVCASQGILPEKSNCLGNENCAEGLLCASLKGKSSGECRKAGQPGTKVSGDACNKREDCNFGAVCGLDSKCVILRPFAGVSCKVTQKGDTGELRVLFEVPRDGKVTEFFRLPYPIDIRRKSDNSLDLTGFPSPGPLLGEDLIGKYIKATQKEVKGFGTNPTIYFRLSKPINFDSIKLNNEKPSVIYINLDTGIRTGFNINYNSGKTPYICGSHIMIRGPRSRPLAPNQTYAVLVMNSLEDKAGTRVKSDKDFDAMLKDSPPSDGGLSSAYDRYKKLRAWLAKNKKEGKYPESSEVIAAAVFTTHTPTQAFAKFREAVLNQAKPKLKEITLCKEGVKSPCESDAEVTSRKCGKENNDFFEIHAKLSLPIFQQGKAPYKTEGGDIRYKSDGTPEVASTQDVCVAITIPKGDMPTQGWPVMIYAHGTGGNLRSHIADGTAKRVSSISVGGKTVKYATVGMDQVVHGLRRGDDKTHPNFLFFNFRNPGGSLGNTLQNAADQLSLVRWIQAFALTSSQSPNNKEVKFNKDKIAYLGHSQGGFVGPLFLAYEPDVKAAVLSGAGAGLIYSLLDKTSPINISAGVRALLGENPQTRIDSNHPVLNLLQHYFDRADAVNYGHLLWRKPLQNIPAKHILQTYGIGDTFTPEDSITTLAFVMGVEHAGTVIKSISGLTTNSLKFPVKGNKTSGGNKITAVFTQYKPADGKDGHFVLFNNSDAIKHFTHFLGSLITDDKGIPSVE